jgi:primosomal protein N' (replication factor Y)
VIEFAESSGFDGTLAALGEVVSSIPVLPGESYQLLKAVADRQACTLGDVLKLAIVTRSVAVEKKFAAENSGYSLPKKRDKATLTAAVVEPRNYRWVDRAVAFALRQQADGFSSIVIVPDFRDLALLKHHLESAKVQFIDYSASRKPSERYNSFLQCLRPGAHIVIGARNSVYAPLVNLGGIFLFDDGDDNLVEPTAPYVHTRDVALVRQGLTNCDLAIEAHYRSTECQRLVEVGHLKDVTEPFTHPSIAVSDDESRLPTMAWQAIRKSALEDGNPVLIQVVGKGIARSTYCFECGERANCNTCNGPIWIDSSNTPKCRWCAANNLNFECHSCGGKKLKQGSGGATRTVSEIGKSFPGAQIIESTGDNPFLEIKHGKRIVVSTPGAEPKVSGGYGCVVILDASTALAKDSLRAQDMAIRNWTNAIALAANDGKIVVSGLPQTLGQQVALWQLTEIASDELANRKELDFPPALRLASIQGEKSLVKAIASDLDQELFQVLGPISLKSDRSDIDQRYIIKYSYANGAALATQLKATIAKLTSGMVRTGSNGRTSRAIRVRMDDPEVI